MADKTVQVDVVVTEVRQGARGGGSFADSIAGRSGGGIADQATTISTAKKISDVSRIAATDVAGSASIGFSQASGATAAAMGPALIEIGGAILIGIAAKLGLDWVFNKMKESKTKDFYEKISKLDLDTSSPEFKALADAASGKFDTMANYPQLAKDIFGITPNWWDGTIQQQLNAKGSLEMGAFKNAIDQYITENAGVGGSAEKIGIDVDTTGITSAASEVESLSKSWASPWEKFKSAASGAAEALGDDLENLKPKYDNFGDVLDGVIDKLKQIMNPEQIKKEMYNQVEKEHRGKASEITPTAMPHDYDIQFITEKLTNSNAGKSVYGPGMPQTSPYGYTDATTGKSVYYGSNVWRGPQETEKNYS